MLAQDEILAALARIHRELTGNVEAVASSERVVLDMDLAEIPVHGQQEQSAYRKLEARKNDAGLDMWGEAYNQTCPGAENGNPG
jgi:hypothetical protein